MKKTFNIGVDIRSSDNLEITRRLYRNITEIAKKLEEQKNRALTTIDLFTTSGEAQRSKLRDYCERLIIDDPVRHVQKTEDLLWRKGFYDIVSAAKKLRKGNTWNDMEKAFLSAHLSVGVGFYHHLILRLQLEYDLNLAGVIDFAYPQNYKGGAYLDKSIKLSKLQAEKVAEVKKCVTRFIHRSLICLGDLARYRLDLDPNWDPQIATRYYKMAVAVDNKYGMPHNQMGTVAGNKNYGLDAVYHYMRSILCQEPFEGADGNLKRTIIVHSYNGKEKSLTHTCIARLLSLLQLWDNGSMNIDKVNQESQVLLNDIENCLNIEKSENIDHKSVQNEDDIEKYLSLYKNDESTYLTDDMIFKIIIICLMKILKMQMKESSEVHAVIAFVLSVFSQLLQFVVIRLQESLLDMSISIKNDKIDKPVDVDNVTKKDKNDVDEKEKPDNQKELNTVTAKENSTDNEKVEINGNHSNGKVKKSRGKSKNLLRKLRRPRNRRNSSDSEASDGEEMTMGSSSEDVNSDITETEEDPMSDENVLSDEGLSDDLTDDEKASSKENDDTSKEAENINGHSDNKEKIVEENENDEIDELDINAKTANKEEKEIEDNLKPKTSNSTYDENSNSANTLTYVAQMEKQKLDPIKVLKVLNDEKMLISIKVCCDWLQGQQDIIKTCAKGSKTLLNRLITLLNLINLNREDILKKWDKDLEIFSNSKISIEAVPLPEDIDLKGLKIFDDAHKNIDWEIIKRKNITNCEETLLRALKIIKFGHYLCSIPESGIQYDDSKGLFTVLNEENNTIKEKNSIDIKNLELDQSKGKLMRHMGKLWLKAEVRALESRLHYRLMSPYLVPDHEAFSKFMPVIKHLVYAKKFIVVVPSVVISALDELKRTSSHAREATRWLETQLQRGSRFLRAQRPHEKLPLPFIKGPKPKDKEAWLYFQIIECCHYLTQQSKAGDSEIPVVTLLTGIDDMKIFTFSPDGLAKSAGANFEHIGSFHAKWKLSIKSHG